MRRVVVAAGARRAAGAEADREPAKLAALSPERDGAPAACGEDVSSIVLFITTF
jgi:hypothetical protein